MTSRIFQDEINASEAEKEAAVTSDPKIRTSPTDRYYNFNSLQKAWDAGFPSQSSYRITHGNYVGSDGDGNPIYSVRLTTPWGSTITKSRLTLRSGKLWDVEPLRKEQGAVDATGGASPIERFKDQWMTWVNEMTDNGSLLPSEGAQLMSKVQFFSGDARELNEWMTFVSKNVGPPPGPFETIYDTGDPTSIGFGGGGGGGGGGGSLGPEYVAPDRRVIEDLVKGTLVSLVGNLPEGMVDSFTDLYMSEHRKAWDTTDRQIDPQQSLIEAVRGTAEYRTVHKLRPDSQDERLWVADRRNAAQRGGLTVGAQEDFAITQATAGGDIPDVIEAASVAQFQSSGSARGTLLDTKIRDAAQSIFRGVRR